MSSFHTSPTEFSFHVLSLGLYWTSEIFTGNLHSYSFCVFTQSQTDCVFGRALFLWKLTQMLLSSGISASLIQLQSACGITRRSTRSKELDSLGVSGSCPTPSTALKILAVRAILFNNDFAIVISYLRLSVFSCLFSLLFCELSKQGFFFYCIGSPSVRACVWCVCPWNE